MKSKQTADNATATAAAVPHQADMTSVTIVTTTTATAAAVPQADMTAVTVDTPGETATNATNTVAEPCFVVYPGPYSQWVTTTPDGARVSLQRGVALAVSPSAAKALGQKVRAAKAEEVAALTAGHEGGQE